MIPMTRSLAALLFTTLVACTATTTGEVTAIGWRPCASAGSVSLRGLAAVSADLAYVGGSDGTLLRTDDGGASWRSVAPPDCADCDFRDVEAIGSRIVLAMVAGQPARIYRSADGGSSWDLVLHDARETAFFDAMAFDADGVHGVLFGDPQQGRFVLLASDDGGCSWRECDVLPPARDGEAAFAASGTCLVALAGGRFALVTGGAGSRLLGFTTTSLLQNASLPLIADTAARGAFSVAGRGMQLCVVGGDYSEPQRGVGSAARSDDGGLTWHIADALGYRSAVQWLDDDLLLATGSHGASVSDDGGKTWRQFGELGFHSLAVAPDAAVWACGSDGRVARLIVQR